MQLYTDKTGTTVVKGPCIPPMRNFVDPRTMLPRQIGVGDYSHDTLLTKVIKEASRSPYQVKGTTKTWYATLHMAGDINVAKAMIQKMILNEGACYQFAEVDYVYSGGCESGFTMRCIHYPRFPENTPEKMFNRIEKHSRLLAEELGQKSFTIETSENSFFYDNGNKHG